MAKTPAAKRYAQALFELGVEHDELEELGDALDEASTLLDDSPELRNVLFNPAVELDERRQVVDAIAEHAKWPKLFRNFLMLLIDNDRIGCLAGIADNYAGRADDHQGRVRARVTTAVELDDDALESLRDRLGELTGKEVLMSTDVDPSLIGGAVARVGSTIYDGSIQNHLQRMREAILQEV